jgi:hypothetical protein
VTRSIRAYTDPFRKDRLRPLHTPICIVCSQKATVVVDGDDGKKHPACDEHMPYVGWKEDPDVPTVP